LKSIAGEMHGKHSDGILAPLEQTIAHSGALIRYAPRNENFALVSRIRPEARVTRNRERTILASGS